MINSLTLRNFRAFKNQTFSFGRINVFVGPNNSGKSSALSALNMVAQTVLSSELSQTPLVLNGGFDTLGTYLDMVHGNRANSPMGLDIGFDNYEIRIDFKFRSQRREIDIVKYELFENKKAVFQFIAKKDSFDLKLGGQNIETLLPDMRKSRPIFRNLFPSNLNFSLFYLRRSKEENKISESTYDKIRRVEQSVTRARIRLRRSFTHYDSLSPFREKPERTYLYSGETAQRIGVTGANTALLMASDTARRGRESKGIQASISRWFQVTGIAKSVRVESISPRHFELVLVDFNDTKHNISDVGFGCSQVLPVLASAINVFAEPTGQPRNPILVIQEPEIHLHPDAQASLGSFFAGIVPENGQLFLETHSDNLILRLARHVADGSIDHNDLRIFFVHKRDGASLVYDIGIKSDGTFSSDWPGGFFPQRQSESLALAQTASSPEKRRKKNEIQLLFDYQVEGRG